MIWVILEWIRYILGGGLLALALIPALLLGSWSVSALFFKQSERNSPPRKLDADGIGDFSNSGWKQPRIAVVIPAHNEELLIGDTLRGVLKLNYDPSDYGVVVVADNCTDATASEARALGARVIERSDNPGKGQALHQAFEILEREPWDAYLVMDADSRLHSDALLALSRVLNRGAEVVQLFYGVLNPAGSIRTAAMELAFASFNGLRARGKAAWGWSCGIFGNGFCIRPEVLNRVPHGAYSIVEDLEYHLKLLQNGYRVHFLDSVWVKAQMPETRKDAASQRVRWERGRLRLIRTRLPGLLKNLVRGRPFALQSFLDVAMPPASLIVLASLAAFVIGPWPMRIASLLALLLIAFHYLLATAFYGNFARTARVLAYLPWYIVWKTITLLVSIFRQRNLPWVRTRRLPPGPGREPVSKQRPGAGS